VQLTTGLEFAVDSLHLPLAGDVVEAVTLECDGVVVRQRLDQKQIVAHVAHETLKDRNRRMASPQTGAHLSRRQAGLHRRDLRRDVAPARTEERRHAVDIAVNRKAWRGGIVDHSQQNQKLVVKRVNHVDVHHRVLRAGLMPHAHFHGAAASRTVYMHPWLAILRQSLRIDVEAGVHP